MELSLNDLSLNDLKQLLCKSDSPKKGRLPVGKVVAIRTVTHYYTGILSEEGDKWLILEEAAWIPDTGRWSEFLLTGKVNEVEPFPDGFVYIGVGAIIDLVEWKQSTLRSVK